jgi:branched-chain amino acid transport system permease protein
MLRTTRAKIVLIVGALLLLALPAIAQTFGQPVWISLGTRVVIYALAAVSLDLILGFGGMASFGHAAYFGLGGYTVGILYAHGVSGEPFLGFIPGTELAAIAWPVAILVAGVAALLLGALSLRTSGVHFIMITLAFAQMLYFFFVSLKTYGGDDGIIMRRRNAIAGLNTRDQMTFYYVCLACLAVFLLLGWRLINSRFGRVIEGIRQNERRMAALGANCYRYKLVAFVIAGAAAGLAGALLANQTRFINPDAMHWTKSGELMIMVILGGGGTLFGPVLGAALLLGLETVLLTMTEHWMFVLGPILVLIVLFARRGLWGFLAGTGDEDAHG